MAAYYIIILSLEDTAFSTATLRRQTCYGPNCDIEAITCLHWEGGVSSIFLIGFLWGDIVNVTLLFGNSLVVMLSRFCCGDQGGHGQSEVTKTGKHVQTIIMSVAIFAELS